MLHASAAVADPIPQGLAARTDLHAIDTLTLSDAQFLAGDTSAKTTTTSGQFRFAPGNGRLPVIVLQHGSGGMGANVEAWARELNAMGLSTFALDGFTGRGLTQVSTDQALLGRLNFILDIYRSLDILAKHPRVDPERIVLMGFSRGGQAALYASLQALPQDVEPVGPRARRIYSVLPGLHDHVHRRHRRCRAGRSGVLGGMADDYNPIAPCKAYPPND